MALGNNVPSGLELLGIAMNSAEILAAYVVQTVACELLERVVGVLQTRRREREKEKETELDLTRSRSFWYKQAEWYQKLELVIHDLDRVAGEL